MMSGVATIATAGVDDLKPSLKRIARMGTAMVIGLLIVGMICLRLFPVGTVSALFFKEQDVFVLPLAYLPLDVLPLLALRSEIWRGPTQWLTRRPAVFASVLSGLTFVIAFAGVFLVCRDYPLSVDEFMATFDAKIFRHGVVLAKLAPEWRPYAKAMLPIYALDVADHSAWSSSYYPMNAAFQALLDVVGLRRAAGAFWAALSVLLTFRLARRLWPDRPEAAVIAALLLATSSQLLITAMTPYAMSAHLALNLLWLTLFLQRGRLSKLGALVVAFAACGLHQLIFHPLFAAPFIVQLWLDRRWRSATIYTLGYALIGLFWASYWGMVLSTVHLPPTASVERGPHYFIDTALELLSSLDLHALQATVENLIRFVSWQNPMTIMLAVIGAPAAWRAKGVLRSLLIGVVLTYVVVGLLQPYQGHSWGYRYQHGLLGSLCVIAALGWIELWGRGDGSLRQAGLAAILVASLFSILILFPIRAFQANSFTAPYARAEALIRRQTADVVLVNGAGLLFPYDLARNDPWLTNRPKVMAVPGLQEDALAKVCATSKVAVFDYSTGRAMGIRKSDEGEGWPINGVLAKMVKAGKCGAVITPDGR